MKRLLSLLLLSSGIFIFAFSQTPTLQWARQIGSYGSEEVLDMVVDASGNVYVTGIFEYEMDADPGPGTSMLYANGFGPDVFVCKYTSGGSLVWARRIGGTDLDDVAAIALDPNGFVCITGVFSGTVDFDPGVGTSNLTSMNGVYSSYCLRLDFNGNFSWVVGYLGATPPQTRDMDIDAAGNVVLIGVYGGTYDFDLGPGVASHNGNGSSDVFVVKLSNTGNYVWSKTFGGVLTEWGNGLTVDALGYVYCVGNFEGTVDFDPGAGTANLTGPQYGSGYILKLDNAGNYVWAKAISGSAVNELMDVTVDAARNVLITGNAQGTMDYDPGPATFNVTATYLDGFVLKLNSMGLFKWAKAISGGFVTSTRIATDNLDNVITVGFFSTGADFDPGVGNQFRYSAGSNDVYVSKLDSNGQYKSALRFGAAGIEYGYALDLGPSGSVHFGGRFSATVDFDPGTGVTNLTSQGTNEAFFAKLDLCQSSSSVQTVSACGSYTWPVNGLSYATSGTRTATIANTAGCDSLITLNLTIRSNTASTQTASACNTYTWPVNGQTYTTSGTRTATIPNSAGCDSVITLNLTIRSNTASTQTTTACNTYTWPVNGQTYTTSGIRTATIPNTAGCDSVITLNLTIRNNTASTQTTSACNTYTWPVNGQTYTTSGIRTATIPNTAGCDSVITLNLTINQATSATLNQSACTSFTLNGQTYTSAGTYTQTLTNAAGCDSTLTLVLTLNAVNAGVTVNGGTLTATPGGLTYQWIDCGNGNAPVSGATALSFTPTTSGSFAVIVSDGACSDTSACEMVVGVEGHIGEWAISIYPNPARGMAYVQLAGGDIAPCNLRITDLRGRLLFQQHDVNLSTRFEIDLRDFAVGTYMVEISQLGIRRTLKLVVQ